MAILERDGELPSAQPSRLKRRAGATGRSATALSSPPSKKGKADRKLATKVDQLSTELAQMKALLEARQAGSSVEQSGPSMPYLAPEDDALSLAASATHFNEECGFSQCSTGSRPSDYGSMAAYEGSSMRDTLRAAFELLNLDMAQPSVPRSAYFRRRPSTTEFSVPQSQDFLRELHSTWTDNRAGVQLSSEARDLAAMHDAATAGLGPMPAIESRIASLVVSPEEALRRNVRCPRPQCRRTDDLLARAYDSGARAGRLGNSLSHLMLALSASLHGDNGSDQPNEIARSDGDAAGFCEAALEAFGYMSRELGRIMSYLVQARRQVWLAQAPLTEATRRTLRSLPVEPGTIFGPAAQEALDRTVQAGKTREQLADLRCLPLPSRPSYGRGMRRSSAPRAVTPQLTYSGGRQRPRRPVQGQPGASGTAGSGPSRPSRRFRKPGVGRSPSRPPRGRGGAY